MIFHSLVASQAWKVRCYLGRICSLVGLRELRTVACAFSAAERGNVCLRVLRTVACAFSAAERGNVCLRVLRTVACAFSAAERGHAA